MFAIFLGWSADSIGLVGKERCFEIVVQLGYDSRADLRRFSIAAICQSDVARCVPHVSEYSKLYKALILYKQRNRMSKS